MDSSQIPRLNPIRGHNDCEIVRFHVSSAIIHFATEGLHSSSKTDDRSELSGPIRTKGGGMCSVLHMCYRDL